MTARHRVNRQEGGSGEARMHAADGTLVEHGHRKVLASEERTRLLAAALRVPHSRRPARTPRNAKRQAAGEAPRHTTPARRRAPGERARAAYGGAVLKQAGRSVDDGAHRSPRGRAPAWAKRTEKVMSELTLKLRAAAESDDVEAIDALIEAGADPNGKNDAGNTALHAAAYRGSVGAIWALLAAGADRNARNVYAATALDIAMRERRGDAADTLRDA